MSENGRPICGGWHDARLHLWITVSLPENSRKEREKQHLKMTEKQTGRKMMLEDAAVTVDDVPAFHPRRLPLLLTILTLLHLLML